MKQAETIVRNQSSGHLEYSAVVYFDDGTSHAELVGPDADNAWNVARSRFEEHRGIGFTVKRIAVRPKLLAEDATLAELRGTTQPHAMQLLQDLKLLAADMAGPSSSRFDLGLQALEKTLISGWTEVDESLFRLSRAMTALQSDRVDVGRVSEFVACAVGMLHRWQDRGKRVGNIA